MLMHSHDASWNLVRNQEWMKNEKERERGRNKKEERKFRRTCLLSWFSCVWFSATPWTVARQTPLSPWDSSGKKSGVGCHSPLQGLFPSQGLNPGLLHCMWVLYHLNQHRSPSACHSATGRLGFNWHHQMSQHGCYSVGCNQQCWGTPIMFSADPWPVCQSGIPRQANGGTLWVEQNMLSLF